VADPLLAKIAFERREFGGLAAPGWFPTSYMSTIDRSMKSPKVWRRETDVLTGASP